MRERIIVLIVCTLIFLALWVRAGDGHSMLNSYNPPTTTTTEHG